jgi:predicted DCC family thiol-disulfide oxidoreductase YuxK
MNLPQLTLFFDGGCHLCSREIDFFRSRLTPPVAYVDIADPHFDAASHGVDPKRVHEVMHVKVGDQVRTSVEAFVAIWDRWPGYRWLSRLAQTPGIRGLFHLAYWLFARIRPWLPRRKRDACETGTCKHS